jgi:hypothetical protein
MIDETQVVAEIIRLCTQIDDAYIRSHSEGDSVHNHNRHDLHKIGVALAAKGGTVLMRDIAKKVRAFPNGRYLEGVWEGIGGYSGD